MVLHYAGAGRERPADGTSGGRSRELTPYQDKQPFGKVPLRSSWRDFFVSACSESQYLRNQLGAARHHVRKAILRAQNHRGKTPGAGRRVQCGAQPDEASNTLTRRRATHNRSLIQAHGFNADADCLRIIRARCRRLFADCLRPCLVADMGCSWTHPFARTEHGRGLHTVNLWTR